MRDSYSPLIAFDYSELLLEKQLADMFEVQPEMKSEALLLLATKIVEHVVIDLNDGYLVSVEFQ